MAGEEFNQVEENDKNYAYCKVCESGFVFKPDEAWWDEKGYGYSTKLTKCGCCGKIVVVKYIEDYGFGKLNDDERYYD